MVLFRTELGEVLREARQAQGRTLRDVAAASSVSLGYLSELERGTKEASSELPLRRLRGPRALALRAARAWSGNGSSTSRPSPPPVALPLASGAHAGAVRASAA